MGIGKLLARAIAPALALALLSLASGARAAEAGDYAPENIEQTVSRTGWLCLVPALCPVTGEVMRQ